MRDPPVGPPRHPLSSFSFPPFHCILSRAAPPPWKGRSCSCAAVAEPPDASMRPELHTVVRSTYHCLYKHYRGRPS
jgi:hypothetical protein